MERLNQIQQQIDENIFSSQYGFEATLQDVIQSTHDRHTQLNAGILAAFKFYSPWKISSVSNDKYELPKVYVIGNTKADSL